MRLLAVSHVIFAAFFVLAAYVQLNDPDYLKWVALYLVASLFSILGCINAIPSSVPIFYGAFVLYYAFAELPPFPTNFNDRFFEQEEVREKGGLCLIAFQMFLVALGVITHNTEVWEDTPKSKKGKQKSSGSSSLNALYLTAIVIAIASAAGAYFLPGYLTSHNVPVAEHCKGQLA